jgi:TolB protein
VVSNANDTQDTVVAGPYPRNVWDEHFVANWSPDASTVIFMADLGTGQAIWQVNANGSGLHKVFTAPPDGTGIDDGPAFTPDGAWIIFTRCCPRPSGYGLWRIHPDGTGLRIVTTETVGPKVDGPADGLPQVSPDGRTIVFNRFADDAERIATVNFAGGRLRELTPGTLAEGIPNWSPDGRRIVFQGFRGFGVVDVWAVNPDGTGLTQVTTDGASLNPSYSPDGTKIIFGRIMEDGSRDLFTMNPDGTGASQLTHTPSSERFPQWAPAA